jgi:hypothetical protein
VSDLPSAAASWDALARSARAGLIFARVGAGADATSGMRLGAIDALADRHAANWRAARLPRRARVLVVASPEPRALAAIVGASRADFEVTLASPTLKAAVLAAEADRFEAIAIAGPSEFAGSSLVDLLVETGRRVERIRLIATYGMAARGALSLDAPPPPDAESPDQWEAGPAEPTPAFRAEVSVARELVAGARIDPGAAIISLVPLGAPGGLIGGALAPMIAGAHMIWQAPFSTRGLVETLEASAPAHLVAPIRVASELGQAGLLDPSLVASLTLVAADPAAPVEFAHGLGASRIFVLRAPPHAAASLDATQFARVETGRPKPVYDVLEIGERHA